MRSGIVSAALLGVLWLVTGSMAGEAPTAKKDATAVKKADGSVAKKDAPAAKQENQTARKDASATKQFAQVFTEWKETLSKLRQLHEDYADANGERRVAIEKEYRELLNKGAAMQSKLLDAAEKAYAEAPNADPELVQLLVAIANGMVKQEQYEDALRWTVLLAEHACPHPELYCSAGIAAFATGNFDDAQKYFRRAAEARKLDGVGQAMIGSVGEYKDLWAKEQKVRAAEAKADDLPRVILTTSKGEIEIELFENEAPNTVANFISLVEKGFYNGLSFHRVLPNFMAQGGCPKGDGTGGPGYQIPCECYKPNARMHFRGSLSMAHAGRDTGGSQFFLTFVPTPHLNGLHTCFGRIVRGTDVLAKLQRVDPSHPEGSAPDKIIGAKVLRKRNHAYEPQKTGSSNKAKS